MLRQTPLTDQLRAAQKDPLRTLIVGAGVAGTTLAQLMRRRGLSPVLIERASESMDAGYMLALMPMAQHAIDALGVDDAYRGRSTSVDRYRVLARTGKTLREDRLADAFHTYGDYRGLSRSALLDVLTQEDAPVSHQVCPVSLDETNSPESPESLDVPSSANDETRVVLRGPDGDVEAGFDLVVVADGIHSHTREMLPMPAPQRTETGWGGWVVWTSAGSAGSAGSAASEPDSDDSDLIEELWGRGFLVGSYPVAEDVGAFVGGPDTATTVGPAAFADRVRGELGHTTPRVEAALRALRSAEDPFFWALDDVRSARWAFGRTVLLGDAAAGFLPTAGIGAGMAMESAWVLAGTLDRLLDAEPHPDRARVASALAAYEDRQRPRVESAQSNSRQLARYMFSSSRLMALGRELAVRVTSIEAALRPIRRLLEHPATIPTLSR